MKQQQSKIGNHSASRLLRATIRAGILALAGLASNAFAQIEWGSHTAGGRNNNSCYYNASNPTAGNVFLDSVDGFASLIFTDFILNVENQSTFAERDKKCSVEIDLIIPQGYYVEALEQAIIAGISKTALASGKLSTQASIFHEKVAIQSLNVNLNRGFEIDEPLGFFNTSHFFSFRDNYRQCEKTKYRDYYTKFSLELRMQGYAPDVESSILINLDSNEMTLQLNPRLISCYLVLQNPPPTENPRDVSTPSRPTPTPKPTEPKAPSGIRPKVTKTPFGYKLVAAKKTYFWRLLEVVVRLPKVNPCLSKRTQKGKLLRRSKQRDR